MQKGASERRLVKNEMLFRELNEQTHRGFREINQLAAEDNQLEFAVGDDTEVAFYCECSDLDCNERIRLSLSEYGWIHRDVDKFIVVPGHENTDVERVVTKRSKYYVVQKNTDLMT